MNKTQFIAYIAETNSCTKVKAEKIINVFTSSVIDAISAGNKIALAGFGHFYVISISARHGINPANGKTMEIAAHNRVSFRAGQKLKNAANT